MLQPITSENYKKIRKWRNLPEVRSMMFTKHEISEEEHDAWWEKTKKDPTRLWLMFSYKGVDLGVVYFTDINNEAMSAYWGFYLADDALFAAHKLSKRMIWIGVEREVIDYAKKVLGLSQLYCEVLEENKAVIKLHEKSGFKEITHTHTHTHTHRGRAALSLTVLSDRTSWLNPWIEGLVAEWKELMHNVSWVHQPADVTEGELCFILSCSKLVKPEILKRNKHNLVVHESDLPKGKGWSPMTWQVLEGKQEIPVTLFEAEEAVDSGPIYLQDFMLLDGHELVDELRAKQADATLNLCRGFVDRYPAIILHGVPQAGEESFYPRRRVDDSRLDPQKTIAEQFNLFRVVDNERYPAFFDWQGKRYTIKIEKAEQ